MRKPASRAETSVVIGRRILFIRGQRVIIAADLAAFYGVSTKRLNEQIRRNQKRFPADFLFRLTVAERDEVVANCDHLARLRSGDTSKRICRACLRETA